MARRGINKVILLGNLGGDPECRTFPSGDMVANFSLATSETWQDKNTGEQREKTEWHRCVARNALAGIIQQYVKKGDKLYVEGRLQTRKWQDQNGQERYTTEIQIDEMQMLTPKGSQGGDSSQPYDSGNYGGGQQNRGGWNHSGQQNRANQGGWNNNTPQQGGNNSYGNQGPAQPQSSGYGPDPDSGMNGGFSDSDIPF